MNSGTVKPGEALTRLGSSTIDAIAEVLERLMPGAVERGEVSVLPEGATAFAGITPGAVAASASYVGGVTGANVFVLSTGGARRLAAAMGAPATVPPSDESEPERLSELELSAVAEAVNQMIVSAAGVIGALVGHEIEISPPQAQEIEDPSTAADAYDTSAHTILTTFAIHGESCRLIQFVPTPFMMRIAHALDDLGLEPGSDDDAHPADVSQQRRGDEPGTGLVQALGDVKLRVWAELGRTQLPLGRALGLPLGAVLELDRTADAPIDLYVNGTQFARGRLLVTDDGEWAFAVDEVGDRELLERSALAARIPTSSKQGA